MLDVEVKPHPYSKEKWEIYVDGAKWRDVHQTIFGKKISFAKVNDWAEWEKTFEAHEYKRVKNYLVWRLSSQNYHSAQLIKLLKDRLVGDSLIEKVISEFQSKGFLDDDLWVRLFMQSQQKRYSLSKIISKLYLKGFNQETLQKIAQKWKNPEEELHSIQNLLSSRYRNKDLSDFKEKQKIIASLLRKGFSYEIVQNALQTYKD